MRIYLTDRAKKDMLWWRKYYRRSFPEGYANAAVHLAKAVELMAENPYLGTEVEGFNLRRYPIHRTPFALIYRVTPDALEIARIWDSRQDPKNLHRV